MSTLWIKICGITRQQDALAAAGLGADAIGLVFYPHSPRAVLLDDVAQITQGLSQRVRRVALFVDPDEDEVAEVAESGLVQLLQFHGSESPEFCAAFGLPYIKALRVKDSADKSLTQECERYLAAEMILLDTYVANVPGGTGQTFDWSLVEDLTKRSDIRLLIAGGLTPENVQQVVLKLRPHGVDVSGGVEQSHGIKDLDKMRQFIDGARSV